MPRARRASRTAAAVLLATARIMPDVAEAEARSTVTAAHRHTTVATQRKNWRPFIASTRLVRCKQAYAPCNLWSDSLFGNLVVADLP